MTLPSFYYEMRFQIPAQILRLFCLGDKKL